MSCNKDTCACNKKKLVQSGYCADSGIFVGPISQSNTLVTVKVKKLDNFFALPEYKTIGAAAMDLYSTEYLGLYPGKTVMVSTGISIELPENYAAYIVPRSSMGAKGIIIPNSPGVLDSDYRGEVKVLLHNLPGVESVTTVFEIKRGERIGQMFILPVTKFNFKIVEDLDNTERGSGGFGSTGI